MRAGCAGASSVAADKRVVELGDARDQISKQPNLGTCESKTLLQLSE